MSKRGRKPVDPPQDPRLTRRLETPMRTSLPSWLCGFDSRSPLQPASSAGVSHHRPPKGVPESWCSPPATLDAVIEAFLLSRDVANCSTRTVGLYAPNLQRFLAAVGPLSLPDVGPLVIQRYLTVAPAIDEGDHGPPARSQPSDAL